MDVRRALPCWRARIGQVGGGGGERAGEKEGKGGRACVNPLYVLRQPRAGGTVIFGLCARTNEGRGMRAARN